MKIRWKLLTLPVLWGALTSPLYSETTPTSGATVDSIVVLKAKRELQLLRGGQVLKSYRISLGGVPVGRKYGRAITRHPRASTSS